MTCCWCREKEYIRPRPHHLTDQINPNSYKGLGWALLNTNEYQEAMDVFRKSLAIKEDWDSYNGLGWALLATNKYKSATNTFRHSIALKETKSSYRGLALALKKANNRVAIEHNGVIANKKKYHRIILKKNDKVEIVQFIGGG